MTSATLERRLPMSAVWGEFDVIAARPDDPAQALTEMVRVVANRLNVDVCSVYVLEPDGEHLVLAATMGLNQDSVGQVRMHQSEGLVGLVAEEMQTVCVEEASRHPRFKYFPEAGEDAYVSFIGVPIVTRLKLHGVFVVQMIEPRDFRDDWADVAQAAARIAPHVRRCRSVTTRD